MRSFIKYPTYELYEDLNIPQLYSFRFDELKYFFYTLKNLFDRAKMTFRITLEIL